MHYHTPYHRVLLASLLSLIAPVGLLAQRPTAEQDQFIRELMSRMTLEEKVGQLNVQVAGDITTGPGGGGTVSEQIRKGNMGAVFNVKGLEKVRMLQEQAVNESRLGIPLLVGMDVIHGYETIFPIPLALSCTWSPELVEQSAVIAAKEASAQGVNWVFSPMVDISVDPRWGRVAEGNGEDPYLSSLLTKAYVEGYQGDLSREHVLACVKHFALYGAAEGGRDYNTVDMSRLRMFNQYLPPYRAAVDAGVGSVMTAFNIVDGLPATANPWLLNHVLRELWGFEELVVTDYGALGEMYNHGIADLATASEMALSAGTDADMCSDGFVTHLADAVRSGRVPESAVDTACYRMLYAKVRLGLFDEPYKHCDALRADTDVYTPEHRAFARRVAAESFVLLKNENNLLPLKKEGKIALLGPLANTRNNLVGTWTVAYTPERYATLREFMEDALEGKGELLYTKGSNIVSSEADQAAWEFGKAITRGDNALMIDEALQIASEADVIVCAMGELAEMSGESSSRTDLTLPDAQMDLLRRLQALGKPIVLLNFSGRPTVMTWEAEQMPAILQVWFGGSEAAQAITDVLFGDAAPGGRLTMTFPKSVGQIPLYYNHLNTGRPVPEGTEVYHKYASNYLDLRNDPLYPFGYGLTYTTFEYGDAHLEDSTLSMDGSTTLTLSVTNTGDRTGTEVVQLYIRDLLASVSRPVKELKGFRRVTLRPGETTRVTFEITPEMLMFYDYDLDYVLEPGDFDLMVGPNSSQLQKQRLTVHQ